MGTLTLQQLRDEARFQLGGRTIDDLPDTRIDIWLDWAYKHIARPGIFPHRSLLASGTLTLVQSDPEYAFTDLSSVTANSQVVAIRGVINETQGYRLRPRTIRQLDEVRLDSSGSPRESSRPILYAVESTNLLLHPAPNGTAAGDTIRVRYWAEIGTLATSGAASTLPNDWDEVIVQGATWRGFRALQIPDRAELAKIEFGQLINEVSDRLRLDALEEKHFETEVDIEQHMRVS